MKYSSALAIMALFMTGSSAIRIRDDFDLNLPEEKDLAEEKI